MKTLKKQNNPYRECGNPVKRPDRSRRCFGECRRIEAQPEPAETNVAVEEALASLRKSPAEAKARYSGAETILTAEAEASATGLERIVFMSLMVIPPVACRSAMKR